MKHLLMKQKLLVSFSLVVLLSVFVGATGMFGLSKLSSDAAMINIIHENALLVQKFQTNIETQRSLYRDAILRIAVDMTQELDAEIQAIEELDSAALAMLIAFELSFTQPESREILVDIQQSYDAFSQRRNLLLSDLRIRAETDSLIPRLSEAAIYAQALNESTSRLTSFASQRTDDMANQAEAHARSLSFIMIHILLACVLISIALAFYLSNMISRPTTQLVAAANDLAVGDIEVALDINRRDEIGQLALAFRSMAQETQNQAHMLSLFAEGDFSQSIPVRSSGDVVNSAINKMVTRSSNTIRKIHIAAEQTTLAAHQISQAAQDLASGSSEQAVSLELFTAQVSDVYSRAKENLRASSSAFALDQTILSLMEEGAVSVTQMVEAMESISKSSQDISNIIKMIDDIALQTKILSLNASVEASRAGAHGMGFAVVAQEVRKLAIKSAEAAKDTDALISKSVKQINRGEKIVKKVEQCLQNVQACATEHSQIIQEVDASSSQQSQSLLEMNSSINQITAVVQSISAIAEETAAASTEMAAQAAHLKDTLSVYKLKPSQTLAAAGSARRYS